MRVGDIAEEFPVVGLDTSAFVAARLIAQDRRPGIVVTDTDGRPKAVLPASQVVKFMVPEYVQSDPALAIGASANVVVVGIAKRSGHPISFWEFTKYGALVAVVTLGIATPYLLLRY